ncbi:hypothetical protein GOP47_0025596 [Adiantum capillus-veneris]|uniref:Uncharacterized protein n=1 Tax=Adiantum capillus-veneris TaxID=13818 RepID=A0A9D4U178_ADICA|nr:hypothetical protein GOP47_0025596 [Adiantum capillus-veneris]
MMVAGVRTWRGRLLLLLLLSFSCGGVATSSASSVEDDDSAIPVLDTVKDLVQQVSAARGWDLDHVRILNIDSEDARFTKALVYELDIQIGDHVLPAKFIDEVTDWQRLGAETGLSDPENEGKGTSWNLKTLQPVLKPFQLNGPLDLSFQTLETSQSSSKDQRDFSHWKEVRLAVGSSVEVSGAQEISLAQPVELSLPVNRSSPVRSLAASIMLLAARTQNAGLQDDDDTSRLYLQISGPALVASITGFDFPSHDLSVQSLKLLYKEESEHNEGELYLPLLDPSSGGKEGSIWPFPILNSSDPRFSVLEEMLKAYMGYGYESYFTILKAKVTASTYVLFEFEIERQLDTEDFDPEAWPEWKTRPTVRKYSFQVLAKVRDNALIPISVQSVKQYKTVETYAWRDVTSNMSFTSFSTFLGISSPMTLDAY